MRKDSDMRSNYDFSKAVRNPYAKRLKKSVTIRIDADTLAYFKNLSADTDIPYQKLINFYLRDCAEHHKKPSITWKAA
jgi:uncharacterized protein (DUF4415 family)